MVLPKASRLLLMLMLLSSSSVAYANEDAIASETEIDIELLEFLGDIAGLESLGVDLDSLLGLDIDNSSVTKQVYGGANYEN